MRVICALLSRAGFWVLDKHLLEHLVVQIGTMLVLDHFSGLEVQRLEVHVPNGEDHLAM